ncbi:PREDICTED: calcium and integrin-binding protein 1-like isoform X1 [Amphimedon queenslandica]|uniref:EF-hand domain-containing protein n=1 Tax=Amphimedon queenslandica TaxID=400682 RepID=A0AAN0JA33_AMPQE|nr:PREDICTED: calcium and integrin-binding protein 1-like isoform X1 [Amphimedon queenslandica]|eukprot:XP_019853612.1 PREDICTED: calcium and integrin-binding protein 1-like isoform X1 [Amphimedon queenslandica]
MGIGRSVFSQDELDLYQELTNLNAAEINNAYKKFKNIDPLSGFQSNKKGRIAFTAVADNVAELKLNPFRYRICMLFCSEPNGLMDFDDFLDMVSVFHDKCPKERKVRWAFRLYDFNDDHVIDYDDLSTFLDLVTDYGIESDLKSEVIQRVIEEVDYDGDQSISHEEFERILYFNAEFYEYILTRLIFECCE